MANTKTPKPALPAALMSALIKTRGEVANPKFDSVGEHGNRYASLSAVEDATRTPATQNGLAFIVSILDKGSEHPHIDGILYNTEGQSHLFESVSIEPGLGPQDHGGFLTHYSRIFTCRVFGITGEEDLDADNVTTPKKEQTEDPTRAADELASKETLAELTSLRKSKNIDNNLWQNYLRGKKVNSEKELTETQAQELIKSFKARGK